MVVFLPMLEGEYLRECSACRRTLLCSLVRERTSFYLTNRKTGKFRAQCRWCYGVRTRDWHERNSEWTRDWQRDYRRRRRERELATGITLSAEEQAKEFEMEADRRRIEQEAEELRRIDEALELERVGVALKPLEEVRARKVRGSSGVVLSAFPFRRWLVALEGRAGSRKAAAELIDVDPGVITEWLEADEVDYETVDRALSREGGSMVRDLYGDSYEVTAPTQESSSRDVLSPAKEFCHTPGCKALVETRERFCGPHKEFYARIRAVMEQEVEDFRSQIGRKIAPKCCNPHCTNDRARGHRYCFDCEDAGWNEEDVA